jgi:hypothetical protein
MDAPTILAKNKSYYSANGVLLPCKVIVSIFTVTLILGFGLLQMGCWNHWMGFTRPYFKQNMNVHSFNTWALQVITVS